MGAPGEVEGRVAGREGGVGRGVVGSSGVLGGFGGLEAGAATVVERGDGIQRRAGGGRGL